MRGKRLGIAVTLATFTAGTLLTAALLAAPAAASDNGFRCGAKIVRSGETQDDVMLKCGDPDASRTWTETQTESVWIGGRRVERSVPVEYSEWKYDFGRNRLVRYLLFVQGRLRDVTTGSYGHH
jgi:hypothetical protein